MNRRAWLMGGVGLAAGAAGVGGAWWQRGRTDRSNTPAGSPSVDVWSLQFDRPEGNGLALADFKGQRLLLNFWATWCPPCVTEMPLLDQFHRQQRERGWQVVGLAVDSPTPVREFLARQPMGFAIGLAGLTGIDLARNLGNTTGALPFSAVFDRNGRLVHTKLGALHEQDLAGWVDSLA
jgi:thiol-disulfide isomerase/thioredoxin